MGLQINLSIQEGDLKELEPNSREYAPKEINPRMQQVRQALESILVNQAHYRRVKGKEFIEYVEIKDRFKNPIILLHIVSPVIPGRKDEAKIRIPLARSRGNLLSVEKIANSVNKAVTHYLAD